MKQKLEELTNSIDLATEKITKLKRSDNWQKDRERFRKVFEKIGFKYLAGGLHRECFVSDNGKYIIKYDRIAKQNKPEINVYAKIPNNLKKYFLKSIAHDVKNFKWILTHKAKTYDNGELSLDESKDIVYDLVKIFKEHNIGVSDLHNQNVGEFKGVPVMIDYGFPITDKTNGEHLSSNSN